MPNGFEGLEINKGKVQVVDPLFGFDGVDMILKKQLYLRPSFGFVGFEFNLGAFDNNGTKKIIKY